VAPKEISPLRVWFFALVILTILAALGTTLFGVLDVPFTILAGHRGVGTTCRAVTGGRFMLPLRA
jgi:uncharacterized membrane protein AbrB (regulator of aidB expression)